MIVEAMRRYYETLHPHGPSPVGTVPDGDEFTAMMGRIRRRLDDIRDFPTTRPRDYVVGFIDGCCVMLMFEGWDTKLVCSFVSVYLTTMYTGGTYPCPGTPGGPRFRVSSGSSTTTGSSRGSWGTTSRS